MNTHNLQERARQFAAVWNPGPLPVGLATLMLGAALALLVASLGIVWHLRDKTLKNPPAQEGLTINFSRGLGLKLYLGAFMAAMALSAMVAVWKPWLWGAAVILLIGIGRLNAALNAADSPGRHAEIFKKTALFIVLWAVATGLGLAV
jgi:1,4-dihydroxy-2-naphthoate octaprenyltransferase